jgi:hypothetical protein
MSAASNLTQGHLAYRESVSAEVSGASYSSGVTAGKLWLPIWSGEVINAYDEYNQFESMVKSRTIPSGTTVEIPITGTVDLKPFWNAGVELVGGSDAKTSTFQLKLDKRPMAAHFEIDNVDMMLTQWEFRNELARQAAQTLSNARDKQIYSYICRAALTSQITNDPRPALNLDSALYGSDSTDTLKLKAWGTAAAAAADRATGALSALEKVEKYIVYLQENNIGYDRLYMAVSPQCFMDIRALGVARASADLGIGTTNTASRPMFSGNDSYSLGSGMKDSYGQLTDALEYMGCTIIKTNHGSDNLRNKSSEDATVDGLGEAKYNLDFSMGEVGSDTTLLTHGIRAVMFTPEAVGAIRLQGLKVDVVDDVRRNTTFTVASMMNGTGVLRPECAAIIHTKDGAHASTDTRTELRHADYADVDADGYAQA